MTESRPRSRAPWPAASISADWSGGTRHSRTSSCTTWPTAAARATPHEAGAGRLPEGTGRLLPIAHRLLRGRGVPARDGILLSLQHFLDRRRHDDEHVPEHGPAPAARDPAALDEAICRRIWRRHDRAAHDTPATSLADRGGQVPR